MKKKCNFGIYMVDHWLADGSAQIPALFLSVAIFAVFATFSVESKCDLRRCMIIDWQMVELKRPLLIYLLQLSHQCNPIQSWSPQVGHWEKASKEWQVIKSKQTEGFQIWQWIVINRHWNEDEAPNRLVSNWCEWVIIPGRANHPTTHPPTNHNHWEQTQSSFYIQS